MSLAEEFTPDRRRRAGRAVTPGGTAVARGFAVCRRRATRRKGARRPDAGRGRDVRTALRRLQTEYAPRGRESGAHRAANGRSGPRMTWPGCSLTRLFSPRSCRAPLWRRWRSLPIISRSRGPSRGDPRDQWRQRNVRRPARGWLDPAARPPQGTGPTDHLQYR